MLPKARCNPPRGRKALADNLMEPTPVIVPPAFRHRAREIQVFYALGLPGMSLLASAEPAETGDGRSRKPKPLVYRCGCGRPISRNVTHCRMCYEIRLMELGEKIDSQETLDQMLKDLDPQERKEALEKIKPYLKFAVDTAPEAGDKTNPPENGSADTLSTTQGPEAVHPPAA